MNEQDFKKTILVLARQDLTINQIVILLKSAEGCFIMRDLAEATGTTVSNVTGAVTRMNKMGLIRRISRNEDRRKIIIAITPKGSKALSALREELCPSVN